MPPGYLQAEAKGGGADPALEDSGRLKPPPTHLWWVPGGNGCVPGQ